VSFRDFSNIDLPFPEKGTLNGSKYSILGSKTPEITLFITSSPKKTQPIVAYFNGKNNPVVKEGLLI
jgi:hypothetical protein